jgi:putative Mg2+ transporter-C (MgtC) family protein
MFVLGPIEADMGPDAVSRVIQGLATGIGFLGAGAIVKLKNATEVHGLTTAAGIWMTAAVSVVIGMGQILQGFAGAILAWAVLALLRKAPVERDAAP